MRRSSGFNPPSARALWAGGCLALLLACKSEPPPPDQAAPAAAGAAPAAEGAPGTPPVEPLQIALPGPYVTAGSEKNRASVLSNGGGTFQWGISGGTITSDAASPSVTYSAGDAGQPLRLFCKVKDEQGRERSAFGTQIIVFPPSLDEFKAVPETVTKGAQGSLQWRAKEIKTLTLDPGAQDVSKVGSVPVQPGETTVYTLRAENLAGTVVSKQVTVKVLPAPAIQSFRTGGPVPVGQPMTLIAEFSGGRGEIKQGDKVLAGSDTSPLSIQVTAADKASFTLTVTNGAGTSVSQTLGFSFTSAYK